MSYFLLHLHSQKFLWIRIYGMWVLGDKVRLSYMRVILGRLWRLQYVKKGTLKNYKCRKFTFVRSSLVGFSQDTLNLHSKVN